MMVKVLLYAYCVEVPSSRRMAHNSAPTHEIEHQGRCKQGGEMVGRYTRGETAGSALRHL